MMPHEPVLDVMRRTMHNLPLGMKVNLGDFAEAISTRVWESVGRANWRKFEDARIFVRGIGLKSLPEWNSYCQSGKKPNDIPSNPYKTYADNGWAGYGDWLGTGKTARGRLRPFKIARAYAHILGLKSQSEWRVFHRSGRTPRDIPINAHQAYADDGWAGWGDWLGTGRIAPGQRRYRTFKDARTYVRGLRLKSGAEWFAYCKSGKKPSDIPVSAWRVYADTGWSGFRDWLGIEYRSFKSAREHVRSLGLKGSAEWFAYCRSGKKPSDIPSNPRGVYANDGWAGMGDWLGTGRIAPGQFRPFRKACAFVRGLGLKSQPEWNAYCNSGKKPADIPNSPNKVYADDGWAGIGDWLGTGRIAPGKFRPFQKARAYVRRLGLKSTAEWDAYCKSGKKPPDIPIWPNVAYAKVGWAGMRDWIGTDIFHYRPFKMAHTFVHGLGLKSAKEWNAYCTSGKKPVDIPSVAYKIYADDGWLGMSDWLGTSSRQFRTFKQARAFVRDLGLKSEPEWYAYCKSGKKPDDIPTTPRRVYIDDGWIGMADWLGAGRSYQHRTFKEARAFVQALGLKSSREWSAFCRSGKKPDDIPSTPNTVYIDDGWAGLGDWLGSGTVANQLRQYRSFGKARAFARALGLKSGVEWKAYCSSSKKPDDIPANPYQVYVNDGWSGIGDWLGTGRVANHLRQYQSFKDARGFARRLGLKSWAQWTAYCKSGKKPDDVPSRPNRVYANDGWSEIGDWLGYAR